MKTSNYQIWQPRLPNSKRKIRIAESNAKLMELILAPLSQRGTRTLWRELWQRCSSSTGVNSSHPVTTHYFNKQHTIRFINLFISFHFSMLASFVSVQTKLKSNYVYQESTVIDRKRERERVLAVDLCSASWCWFPHPFLPHQLQGNNVVWLVLFWGRQAWWCFRIQRLTRIKHR